MKKFQKFAILTVISGGLLFQLGGCGFDSLLRNVWRGFGYGIGNIPAAVVNDAITTLLGGATGG